MDHTKTTVTELPNCDFPHGVPVKARYDGRTTSGQWANMCISDFAQHGIGLGLGKGQEFVLKESSA
jgi:hypothetical protein